MREEFAYRSVEFTLLHGNVQINLVLDGKIDAVRLEIESEMGKVEIGDVYFGSEQFLVRPPEWATATLQTNGKLDVLINGSALASGIWLGRLYVRDKSGWHSVIAARGDLLTFVTSRDYPEPKSIRTFERTKKVLGWLNICHALESWQEGGVGVELTKRKSVLVGHLD